MGGNIWPRKTAILFVQPDGRPLRGLASVNAALNDMNIDRSRYEKAVRRNIADLNNAILERRALIGLHSANSAHGLDFFMIASHALFNDIVAHAILVFDQNSQSASFWYVCRCDEALMNKFAKQRGIPLDRLSGLSKRFKIIRDRTHFHIDKQGVLNPSDVWFEARITGNELGWALESAYDLLADIQESLTGTRPAVADYDGSDAAAIIRAYNTQHPDAEITV